MPRILLGVCGGIAAYKALELTRLALKAGHSVRVVQTEASTRFVGPASFAGVTGAPVLVTEWEPDPLRGVFPGDPQPEHAPLSHLALVEHADVFLIAPATAHTVAKLATARRQPADRRRAGMPATADRRSGHEQRDVRAPATQDNLATLRARGVTVLEPGTGALGSPGEFGIGRLPEPPELLAAVENALRVGGELDGAKVLVTAGGTREPIDSVRFVGNRSSGRMGLALAEEAQRRGADVTVVAANVSLPRPAGIEYVDVETAAELADACAARFEACDVLLMAAAVADYRPPTRTRQAQEGSDRRGTEPAARAYCGRALFVSERRRPGQLLVGFAAEHGEGALAYGREQARAEATRRHRRQRHRGAGIGFESRTTRSGSSRPTRVARAGGVQGRGSRAILDTVLSLRSSNDVKVRR